MGEWSKVKRQIRFFNTTGPCNPWDHYMLPPEERLVGAQLHRYIRDQLYWVLHAPRQTGKTTFLQSWMREINRGTFNEEQAFACYVSLERCQGLTEPAQAMPDLCQAIQEYAAVFGAPVPDLKTTAVNSMVSDVLRNWAVQLAPKVLVVLFDEVDVLEGQTLISFLRQLRGGFAVRGPGVFPVSIALVGMRDLQDYITSVKGGVAPNPGSPFNIKADSVRLSDFQREDIARLFAQRTAETGQEITQEALDSVFEQSQGQPWIVNSLFAQATLRILGEHSRERVTANHIMEARERMVQARETHLDALAYRMADPRIGKVMETLMTGEPDMRLATGEGFRLCMDLGLVNIIDGVPSVANPLYREVLAQEMTYGTQLAIPRPEWAWQKADGSLDMEKLLREFQRFWRENSEIWEEQSDYTEAFPHLLLMAFLQRVLNGEGRIEREYAAGRGRMDLYVAYQGGQYVLEIKLVHEKQNLEPVIVQGLEQIARYRDRRAPEAPAYLLIVDRRLKTKSLPWEERLFWRQAGTITIVGA